MLIYEGKEENNHNLEFTQNKVTKNAYVYKSMTIHNPLLIVMLG